MKELILMATLTVMFVVWCIGTYRRIRDTEYPDIEEVEERMVIYEKLVKLKERADSI